MKSQTIKEKIKKLPDAPGVYFFTCKNKILYIGKATSLRDRVRSYFSGNIEESRGPLISKMIASFDDIAFQKTDSVLEALILEAALIKKHQPKANTDLKDDKSFNYVVITKEDWPRVLIVRRKEIEKENNSPPLATLGPSLNLREGKGRVRVAKFFGPFPNGTQLREAIKIVRRMFPFRGNKCEPGQGRACFERQLGLCPGVCTGEITKEDYGKQIKNIILFFEGNKKGLVRKLKKEMRNFAKKREFEKAEIVKRQLYAIYHIQDVSLIKSDPVSEIGIFKMPRSQKMPIRGFRIESYDIAHLSGTNVVGVMTVVEDGEVKKSDYRKFKIKWFNKLTTRNESRVNDTKALSEVLSRRLNHPEWPFPNLIVVDGGVAQKRAMEKVLEDNGLSIPVVSVVKDERHRPKGIIGIERLKNLKIENWESQMLLANSEAHRFAISFHKHLRRKFI